MEDPSTSHPRDRDAAMMRRALDLAARGRCHVSPNPMVGAVIVDADGSIVAEGWHEHYGGPHAEVNALRRAEGRDLSGATLYVTLEPCNHHGKTPPCTDAVLRSGLRRVVIAMRDPNPLVSGQGNHRLRSEGIEVVLGVEEKEAKRLNESYIHFIQTGRPFITVKLAQTLDGYIALPDGESRWITGEPARRYVHELRAASDAVLVGHNTARLDDPALTVRYGIEGRNPRRVILDAALDLPASLQVFTDEHRASTIVFVASSLRDHPRAHLLAEEGLTVVDAPVGPRGEFDLDAVVARLGLMGIASLLVEGGATLASAVVQADLAQKIILFTAPKVFGHGVRAFTTRPVAHVAEAHQISIHRVEMIGEDAMMVAYWHRG